MSVLSDKQTRILLTVADRIVPEMAEMDQAGRERFLEIVEATLMTRSPSIRRQFGVFLNILNLSPIPTRFRSLMRLSPEARDLMLRKFQYSSSKLLRIGLWGLKTLIFMGYYGQEAVKRKIGFTPSLQGNEKLHDR